FLYICNLSYFRNKSKRKVINHGPDEDYGQVYTEKEIVDMPVSKFEDKKNEFLTKIRLADNQIDQLKNRTIGQSNCDEWRRQRKFRLTASNFGKVVKLRASTSRANTVKYILYDFFQGNASTRYGIQSEPLAKEVLQHRLGVNNKACSLFVHKTLQFLAASPDGLIDDDSIVEIKCPASIIKDFTPKE
ncbi:uncharacterized protein LOC126910193, partial [Daktulosphaira vitifoliae]|uniref:uncharacterized protein LOC126910193 n=1 Tax=Daktulosphaira vitifoliae TaxID=58002 RepID=UPI0021AA0D3E